MSNVEHKCECCSPQYIHIIMRPAARASRRHAEVLYFLDLKKAREKCAELNRELIDTDVGLEKQFYIDTRRFLDDGKLYSGNNPHNNGTPKIDDP